MEIHIFTVRLWEWVANYWFEKVFEKVFAWGIGSGKVGGVEGVDP